MNKKFLPMIVVIVMLALASLACDNGGAIDQLLGIAPNGTTTTVAATATPAAEIAEGKTGEVKLEVTISEDKVESGQYFKLSWESDNADACFVDGDWKQDEIKLKSSKMIKFDVTVETVKTYMVACENADSYVEETVEVVILAPEVTPTAEPTETPVIATPEPIAEPVVTVVTNSTSTTATIAGPNLPMTGTLFYTPVECKKSFNPESAWLVCEDGVLLDNTTAWIIPATDDIYHSNVPEGGFTYYSCGQCNITLGDVVLSQQYMTGTNYLVLIRGTISDGIVDTDLNGTALVSNFVAGHMIYSHMPSGAYVSHDWFRQQLVASMSVTDHTKSFTNCGDLGCSRTIVILYDASTHQYQKFEVHAENVDLWKLIETNAP